MNTQESADTRIVDPARLPFAYQDALNAGDADAVVALFHQVVVGVEHEQDPAHHLPVLQALDKLPFPVHSKVILTRDGVVLSFVPGFHSVQPCELL
jgi:hypothetical protein